MYFDFEKSKKTCADIRKGHSVIYKSTKWFWKGATNFQWNVNYITRK